MNTKTTPAKKAAKTPVDPLLAAEGRAALAEDRVKAHKQRADENADRAFAVKQDFDIARGKWEAEKAQLTQVGEQWRTLSNKREEEINALRAQVLDLSLTNARLNGYMDGIEDSKPPRMVEEPRQLRRMEIPANYDRYADAGGFSTSRERRKQWFER